MLVVDAVADDGPDELVESGVAPLGPESRSGAHAATTFLTSTSSAARKKCPLPKWSVSVVSASESTSGELEKSKSPDAMTASADPVPSVREGPLTSMWLAAPPRTSPSAQEAVIFTSTLSSPSPFVREVGVRVGALPHAVT